MVTKIARGVCFLLFRLLLPSCLLIAGLVRYNALSFLYTLFLLVYPLLGAPTPTTIRGGTGIYLRVVFVVGLLAVLAQAVFHITLTAIATDEKPYGSMFPNCSDNERLARQIGLQRLDGVSMLHVIRLVVPDVAVFLTGLIVYVICYKLLPAPKTKKSADELPTVVRSQTRQAVGTVVQFIGETILVIFLAASGIIVPSAISAVYFISFIFLATLWSLYGHLGAKFSVFRLLLLIYSGVHILVLYLYQFQFFQNFLDPDDFVARLLGLTAVVSTHCSSPSEMFWFDPSKWQNFFNPGIVLCLYFTLAVEVRRSCTAKLKLVCLMPRKSVVVSRDNVDGSQQKKKQRRRNQSNERQHLVTAEVQDYSSIEAVGTDRSGSPTMLTTDDELDGDDHKTRRQKSSYSEKRPGWMSAFVFIMRQSYVLSLIAMMAWSITYHSWLTFVLLLAACVIWMTPNSRRVILVLSPFILFYGIALLCIQFVYGMNLDPELPDESNGIKLSDIGLKKFKYPCLPLALQVVYTLMFWLMLRQYIRERRLNLLAAEEKYQLEEVGPSPSSAPMTPSSPMSLSDILQFPGKLDTPDGYDSNTTTWLGHYILGLLCKYFILICAGMMLIISLQEVVVYRIIYMIFFLIFILTFQYAYKLWRLTMFMFWWCVIIYSMIILIILYTYQFESVEILWKNTTGLSSKTLADIGLEHFDTAGLFVRLLSPTTFLIFLIIQVHYFHTPFLRLSDLDRFKFEDSEGPSTGCMPTSDDNTTDTEATNGIGKRKSFGAYFKQLWAFASSIWAPVTRFLWRLAAIHIFKLVAFTIIMVSTHEVSAVSAVLVILLSIILPMTGAHFVLSHIAQFWTATVILAKMIYQLDLVDNSSWLSNCTIGNVSKTYPFNEEIDNAKWAGMERTDDAAYYLKDYIGILLIIILERVVVYHQQQYYNRPGFTKPRRGIIFEDIKRRQADDGIIPCMKFFLNFFFHKFGLECCYIMSAITICVRVDVFSMIYAVFLGLLLLLSRRANARVWPVYTIILVILLPIQFLSALGLPLFLCFEYIWDARSWVLPNNQGLELEQWLFLPDYMHPPDAHKLVADFFQLLLVSLQWRVFRQEVGTGDQEHEGGTNEDITLEVEAKQIIPVDDFTTKVTSYLDVIKNFVFMYMFWVTLAIVFIAGTTRINLFSMGYVIAVFCFMWFGQEFLIKPLRQLVRAWNFLLGFCFMVILLKAALQLPGCVYIKTVEIEACWLVQLLGLNCLRPGYVRKEVAGCIVEEDNTGLAWDVVCFVFLLMQRRIYTSHYFRHVVADFEAQNRLASRGCQLINRILMREVAKQKEDERTILATIKEKMDSLKKKQLSLKKDYVEPEEHFQAIRSGDYYLFEESDDEEHEVTTITLGQDKGKDTDAAGPSPLQLISTAVTSGPEEAVKKAKDAVESHHRLSTLHLHVVKPTPLKMTTPIIEEEESDEITPDPATDDKDKDKSKDKEGVDEPGTKPLEPKSSDLETPGTSQQKTEEGSSSDFFWAHDIFREEEEPGPVTDDKDKEDDDEPRTIPLKRKPSDLQSPGPSQQKTESDKEDNSSDFFWSYDIFGKKKEPSPDEDKEDVDTPVEPKSSDPKSLASSQQKTETDTGSSDFFLTYADTLSKVETGCRFMLALLVSIANWLTALFNRISRNYRLVAAKMKDDHINAKLQIQMEHRRLSVQPVEMEENPSTSLDHGLVEVTVESATPEIAVVPVRSEVSLAAIDLDKFDEEEEEFERSQPCLYRLLVATYFAIVARSEMVCYFLMILNHILSASIISLPLPMLVFLWGMLSVPRPTKTFWITVITYTEAVVVVKYLFQFGFFPWNGKVESVDPAYPPKIIGIEQKDGFAIMDLILLLALFIHRTVLKRYGLWKDEGEIIESKNQSIPSIAIEDTDADEIKDHSKGANMDAKISASSMKPPSSSDSMEQECNVECAPKKFSPLKIIFRPFTDFYRQLTCPDYNATTDVYAPMFACDFINFLIIVFGYQAFGPSQSVGSGDVSSYISEDRIPVPFLIMLLLQFVLIIVDRALYLRKNVLGKFIFQILLVVLLHMWLFFILPFSTNKPFTTNKTVQLWYFIKCVYFALSAYQIRSAYPTRILGNFLTKKYNYVNLFLFKGFLAIPFLLELRTLMDWTWTNTTMAIGNWLQMEDIYANIYILKCWRVIETDHPTPRATPKPGLIKYGVGGLLLFIVIFIVWFPLVIFSFANTVYVPNLPHECKVSISLAGYQALFEISGQQQTIRSFSESEYQSLKSQYDRNAVVTSFLSNYNYNDLTIIQLNGKSTSLWTISPPNKRQLMEDLQDRNVPVNMEFYVTFTRNPHSQAGETLAQQYRHLLTQEEKNSTFHMLNGTSTIPEPVTISNVYPKFLRLGSKEATQVAAILGMSEENYSDLSIYLNSFDNNGTQPDDSWWEIKVKDNSNNLLTFLTFNDRVAPEGFSMITGYGIIGLYVSLVLVIGRFTRAFFSGGSQRIMFEEMPNADRIMSLCLNLYLARECGDYYLEEQLFSKLMFVYRSTEVMIRYTKFKPEKYYKFKQD